MKRFLLTTILMAASLFSWAQTKGNRTSARLEVISRYTNKGKQLIDQQKYEQANDFLIKARQLNTYNDPQLAVYNTAFADMFYKLGAFETANSYERQILRYGDKIAYYYSASNIGRNYLLLDKVDSAVYYFKKQLNYSKKHLDFMAVSSSLNNIGFGYLVGGDYSKANYYFKMVYDLLKKDKGRKSTYFPNQYQDLWITVNDNLGVSYYHLGNLEKAQELLEFAYVDNRIEFVVVNQLYLNEIYCKKGLFAQSKAFIQGCQQRANWNEYSNRQYITEMKLYLAIYTNNKKEAIKLAKTLQQIDLLLLKQRRHRENRISKLVSFFMIREAEMAMKKVRNERNLFKKQLLIEQQERSMIVISSVLFLIITTITFYTFRQTSRNKQQQLLLKEEKLQLELKEKELTIRTQKVNLVDYALDINKNKDFEASITKKLNDILQLPLEHLSKELSTLMAELKQKSRMSTINFSETEESDVFLQNFRSSLIEKHPDLRKSEVQLCQFIRLDLSNKDIALLKGVTTESVKIAKNRLKHRMSVAKEESIYNYLKNIG